MLGPMAVELGPPSKVRFGILLRVVAVVIVEAAVIAALYGHAARRVLELPRSPIVTVCVPTFAAFATIAMMVFASEWQQSRTAFRFLYGLVGAAAASGAGVALGLAFSVNRWGG